MSSCEATATEISEGVNHNNDAGGNGMIAEFDEADYDKGKKRKKKTKQRVTTEPDDVDDAKMLPRDLLAEGIESSVTVAEFDEADYDKGKKKKKGKQRPEKMKPEVAMLEELNDQPGGRGPDTAEVSKDGTVKTAAQKKKEKKERERMEKAAMKDKKSSALSDKSSGSDAQRPTSSAKSTEKQDNASENDAAVETADVGVDEHGGSDTETKSGKKKKKKDKGKDKEKPKEKEPKDKRAKMAARIREQQERQKQEEERIRQEQEEAELAAREAEDMRLAEIARKESVKQARKEREKAKKEQQKKEGTYMTEKQKREAKLAALRNQKMLEARAAALGQSVDAIAEPPADSRPKPRYDNRRRKPQKSPETDSVAQEEHIVKPPEPTATHEHPADADTVADDALASDEDGSSDDEEEKAWDASSSSSSEYSSSEDEDTDESDEESSDESSESEQEERTADKRQQVIRLIEKRHEECEARRSIENLRAPIICVLGHVDTGKTKILDKLRNTHVQDGEAGGITQQIGATNVPAEAIEKAISCLDEPFDIKVPGLLIIDTPGHESFSNLRSRGSNLCDLAILVVDIMHALEPQTLESIELLKKGRTPFLVALNKVDRLYGWQPSAKQNVQKTIEAQNVNTTYEFEQLSQKVITEFAEQGLNAALFYKNPDPKEFINLVPTSAFSGDGIPDLIDSICRLSQTFLASRLSYSEELQGTVMEVKEILGLGTTIDVALVNGKLCEGDTIVVAGMEGPIVTPIRALVMPQPMKELRVKNQYVNHKEVVAAQGVKVVAKELEKTLAGLPLYVARNQGEIDYYKELQLQGVAEALAAIRTSDAGVYVTASTLGSLEALLAFLRSSDIPFSAIAIGPVHKRDVMKASAMLERDSQWAVILAFDVKIEHDAQQLAESMGVLIFTADIIYHLFDKFMEHRDNLKKAKQECAYLGKIGSIESNHKALDEATKGMEVCIKIIAPSGEAPRLFGRHFDEDDVLVSRISRESIDAIKAWFKEDMSTEDWKLTIKLKKLLNIM